jgi:hypothetical protein
MGPRQRLRIRFALKERNFSQEKRKLVSAKRVVPGSIGTQCAVSMGGAACSRSLPPIDHFVHGHFE